ncbi:hypothetical protein [Natrinema limicola]|uniref:hypothetical protein n=1 Tax=Natrinema limicola TaxID=370323 RepID=UPI001F4CA124|nr:hypothetical protein [Natrinema limicola]
MDRKDKIKMFLTDPRRLLSLYHFFGEKVNSQIGEWRGPPEGTHVMDKDWDSLLILDGCRYDLFERVNTIDGLLESRTSLGSYSGGFLQQNFRDQAFHDTIYVTANPYSHEIEPDTFHATINVLEERWDAELGTVPPEEMADAVREAHETYPNKRLIGHFMQPHVPFIGPTGQDLPQGGIGPDRVDSDDSDDSPPDIWRQLQFRLTDVDHKTVLKAYEENLEIVLEEIRPLLNDLDGKTVISSDHGNLLGEWIGPFPAKGFGHPPRTYAENLITVPWLEIPAQNRREIRSDAPVTNDQIDDEVVEQRLKDLGYA